MAGSSPQTRQIFTSYFFSLMTCLNMYYSLVLFCLLPLFPKRNRKQLFGLGFICETLKERAVCVYTGKGIQWEEAITQDFRAPDFTKRTKFISATGRVGVDLSDPDWKISIDNCFIEEEEKKIEETSLTLEDSFYSTLCLILDVCESR